jgi:hypothetical protein
MLVSGPAHMGRMPAGNLLFGGPSAVGNEDESGNTTQFSEFGFVKKNNNRRCAPASIDKPRAMSDNSAMEPGIVSISLLRDTNLFSNRPQDMEDVEQKRQSIHLIPDQLFHPDGIAEYIVRLGKLRVSQFLPDGREITRAVLQAGSAFQIRKANPGADDPAADIYDLADIVLMALGEGELWALPAGTLRLESGA